MAESFVYAFHGKPTEIAGAAAQALVEKYFPHADKKISPNSKMTLVVDFRKGVREVPKIVEGANWFVHNTQLEVALQSGVPAQSVAPCEPVATDPMPLLNEELFRRVHQVIRGVHLLDNLRADRRHVANLQECGDVLWPYFPSWLTSRPGILRDQWKMESLLQQFFLGVRSLTRTRELDSPGLASAATNEFLTNLQRVTRCMLPVGAGESTLPEATEWTMAFNEGCNCPGTWQQFSAMRELLLAAMEAPEVHAVAAALPRTHDLATESYVWQLGVFYAFGRPSVVELVKRSAGALHCLSPLPLNRQYALLDDEGDSKPVDGDSKLRSTVDVIWHLASFLQSACNTRQRSYKQMSELAASLDSSPRSFLSLFHDEVHKGDKELLPAMHTREKKGDSLHETLASHAGGVEKMLADAVKEEMLVECESTKLRKVGGDRRTCYVVKGEKVRQWRAEKNLVLHHRTRQQKLLCRASARIRKLHACLFRQNQYTCRYRETMTPKERLALQHALIDKFLGRAIDHSHHRGVLMRARGNALNAKRADKAYSASLMNGQNQMCGQGESPWQDEAGTLSAKESDKVMSDFQNYVNMLCNP